MVEMILENVRQLSPSDIAQCDFSFEVTCELVTPYDNPFEYVKPLSPYRKAYMFNANSFLDLGSDQMLAVAKEAGQVRGYILISKGWNNYAVVDDFAVDRNIRRAGIGTRLMDQAVEWTKERGLPGMRLETQSSNVQACRFYRKYGFDLGGYDKYLYAALGHPCNETALFWYLKFERLL